MNELHDTMTVWTHDWSKDTRKWWTHDLSRNKLSGGSGGSTQKNDFTQYYDFIYEYKTDCISISLNYNKSFYRDGSLEPSKSISFLIKIIPFTELGVTNLENIIGS
mgnify:CR=1 FL=1